MSLYFGYRPEAKGRPLLSLGGRFVRPRPIVAVTLIGPAASRSSNALLDTGADDTVFPEFVAAQIGVDLTNAPAGGAAGAGSAALSLRYAEVTLHLTDGSEVREWKAWVGFTPARLHYPLLGFAGCLQFFTAIFRGDREECELAVNGLYPGT